MSDTQGTPYSFDKSNPAASLAQKAGKGIGGFFLGRSKTFNTLLGHELRIREQGINTMMKSEATQNEMRTQGDVETNVYRSKLTANVEGAGELNKVAAKGTSANLSDRGVEYTTPRPAPRRKKSKPAAAPVAKAAAKPAQKAATKSPKPAAKPAAKKGGKK